VIGSSARNGARYPYWDAKVFPAAGNDPFEITIVETPVTLPAWTGYGSATYQVPVRLKNIRTGEDFTQYLVVVDMIGKFPNDSDKYHGPPGTWDLQPGGACWNPILDNPGADYTKDADKLLLRKDGQNVLVIYTVHPPDGKPPSVGDRFYIGPKKPFPRGATYRFSTTKSRVDPRLQAEQLPKVKVVPNPYIVSAAWDIGRGVHKVAFTNLPRECRIDIYNVAGDRVTTIEHRGLPSLGIRITPGFGRGFSYARETEGVHEWDLINDDQLEVAPGLYIFVVTTPDGRQTTGKFAIIR